MMRIVDSLIQGPLLTFGVAELAMKLSCCIGTLATFKRVVDEQQIPKIFLCLPSLLVLLFILQKFTQLRDDPSTLGMITGALIGVITGFLSAIDKVVQPDFPGELDIDPGPDPVFNLELLHIPVVLGAVMYSFTLVFERLPSPHKLQLAATVAMVGSVLVTTVMSIMSDTKTAGYRYAQTFFIALLAWFLIGLLPSVQSSQQAWIACTVIWLVQLIWQSRFFDNLVWDWKKCRFPIPGYLTGMIVLFFGDIILYRPGPHNITPLSQSKKNQLSREPLEPMTNCFLWHAITFVVQRISLYVIESRKRGVPHMPSSPYEASVTCVLCMLFLHVSSNMKASSLMKVTIVSLSLVFYVLSSLSNMALPNGLFIDISLGLTIVYTVQMYHLNSN